MTTTIQESGAPARNGQAAAGAAVSGIVDIGDGHAFVRVSGYRRNPADVYVSAGQIRQYGLRQGDQIEGAAGPQPRRQAQPAGPRRHRQRNAAGTQRDRGRTSTT